jgi:DNA-binding CsgD family transcriptional regulator
MIAGFRAADGMRIGQQAKQNLSWHEREDGMIDIRARLPEDEAALLLAAIEAAKDQFGPPPAKPDPCGEESDGTPDAARYSESLVRLQACDDTLGLAWCHDMLGIAACFLGEYSEASSHFLVSATQFESLDAPLGACHTLVHLGLTLRIGGKLPAALDAYRHALRYQQDYRFTTESADILDGLATIAAALNRLDLSVKLFGTAFGWRETYQQEQPFPMPNDFHESAASVRRRLGERAWFEAYEAGRKLNSEQAIRLADEALSVLEEDLQRRSSGLTDRAMEVLHLVADGLSNAEIAERLVLSERTVHAHLRSIYDKLGVSSRTAAAHAFAAAGH